MKSSWFTRILRILRLAFWLVGAAFTIGRLKNSNQAERNAALSRLSYAALAALDVRLTPQGLENVPADRSLLLVANHISWLDIFALNALVPTGFIAKKELRSWPLVGRLMANVGTVFIDRSSRKDTETIVRAINQALENGASVCFFPEARTSEGLALLPFKAALFQSALDTQTPIQAAALRYYDGQGRRTAEPSYAGDISLFASLWKIVSMKTLDIRVDFLAPQTPEGDRFAVKETAEAGIAALVYEDSPVLPMPSENETK